MIWGLRFPVQRLVIYSSISVGLGSKTAGQAHKVGVWRVGQVLPADTGRFLCRSRVFPDEPF